MEARNNFKLYKLEEVTEGFMKEPMVSVIVAVYNVEKYIAKCIESILYQTYENIELIIVDDGSIDNSLKICNEYATRDSRIKIITKENGGQATARNVAMDVAKGEYIGFVDGDDWIEPNMYEALFTAMVENDVDIIQCGWYKVDASSNQKTAANGCFGKEFYTSNEGLDELCISTSKHLNTSVCCKLFRGDIAKQFRFTPVRAYEDDEYRFKTVSVATSILCIDTPLYNYLNRANSTMTSVFSINKIALVTIQKNICELLKVRYPQRFYGMQKALCSKQFYILNCLLQSKSISNAKEEAAKIEKSILLSYDEYMKNPQMGKNRLRLLIFRYMPREIWAMLLRKYF